MKGYSPMIRRHDSKPCGRHTATFGSSRWARFIFACSPLCDSKQSVGDPCSPAEKTIIEIEVLSHATHTCAGKVNTTLCSCTNAEFRCIFAAKRRHRLHGRPWIVGGVLPTSDVFQTPRSRDAHGTSETSETNTGPSRRLILVACGLVYVHYPRG